VVEYSLNNGKRWTRLPHVEVFHSRKPEMSYCIFGAEEKAIEVATHLKANRGLMPWIAHEQAVLRREKEKWDAKITALVSRKETLI
jgi:hypothetical protein